MKEPAASHVFTEKGMTLVELLASLIILSIVIVSLLSMFVQTARSNQAAKNLEDATFIAETEMENLYNLSTENTFTDAVNALQTEYTKTNQDCPSGECFYKESGGRFVFLQLKENGSVIVKVFKDETKAKLEAQMEMLLTWNK
jgi:prepilin-type N-terminal cleavage/methylation domain-containing protein